LVLAYTRLVAHSARQAAAIITDSLASKQDIEQHLQVPEASIHCIYLAADRQYSPDPTPKDQTIRDKYSLPQRYILYLAGHDVRKNVRSLVEAFAIVARSDDEVALVIGGRLPQRDTPVFFHPRPLVESLGLQERIHLIGWVDEVHKPALYRGASCAVFASLYEGFGLPVLEALGCGTPLITSKCSSLPELVGDAGFVIDPTNVEELAGAILSCLVDDALAAELRQRAPLQAAQFSWAKTARETVQIYREVASCGS
jgi:glycosyltransferase involved in cell wall biosynthesis